MHGRASDTLHRILPIQFRSFVYPSHNQLLTIDNSFTSRRTLPSCRQYLGVHTWAFQWFTTAISSANCILCILHCSLSPTYRSNTNTCKLCAIFPPSTTLSSISCATAGPHTWAMEATTWAVPPRDYPPTLPGDPSTTPASPTSASSSTTSH